MSAVEQMLATNHRAASTFRGGLPAPPSRRVAVLTCMDARIDAYAALGLQPGQAHVLRNAGGVLTDDVVRSLAISQRRLGTREIVLVHHTDCGMTSFTDAEFAAELAADGAPPPGWAAQAFADVETDVRRSIAALRSSPYLTCTDAIRGFVLDVGTGLLGEVDPATT